MKHLLIFIGTHLAVVLMLLVSMRVLGVEPYREFEEQ